MQAGICPKDAEDEWHRAKLEVSEELQKIPVIYKLNREDFKLSDDFEALAKARAPLTGEHAGLTFTEKYRDSLQQRSELYPLILAYGEHICTKYPQVYQVLSILMGKGLEPLVTELKPLLTVEHSWQMAQDLLKAMKAQLETGCFGSENGWPYKWDLPGSPEWEAKNSWERGNAFDAAREDEGRLHASPVELREEILVKAVRFLERQLQDAPASLQKNAENYQELCGKYGNERVAACAEYLRSEEGTRLRRLRDQRYSHTCATRTNFLESTQDVWHALEDRDIDNICTDDLAFADAFPDHWFLCDKFHCIFIAYARAGSLDSDACMCALAAINGAIDLGKYDSDLEMSPQAVHERAGLLFAPGEGRLGYCRLGIEWVPALFEFKIEESFLADVHKDRYNVERVSWGRVNADSAWYINASRIA